MAENFGEILQQIRKDNKAVEDKRAADLREQMAQDKKNLADLGKKLKDATDKNTKDTIKAQINSIKATQETNKIQKSFKSDEVKSIEEQKNALDRLKLVIEGQGGKAEENAEYNKESLKIQNREFDLRLKNAGSASAREEIEKERRAAIDKQGTFLQKIASGISGIGANMKEKALAVGKGLGAILKGTLFAGLLLAFAKFLQSPYFKDTIDFIDKTLKKLNTFYDAFFGEEGSFGKGIKTLFSDESGLGKVVVGIIGLTGLFAAVKLTKAFAPLKASLTRLITGIGGIGKSIPPVIPTGDTKTTPSTKDGKPSKLGKIARFGKLLPGFGLAITALNGVFDGVRAGLQEAEKDTASTGSIIKAASAGILSGLTFNLVSQETISKQFDKVGKAFSTAGDTISKDFTAMKDSVVSGFNKYLGPEAQWAKDFETTLQDFKIPTLDEITTSLGEYASSLKLPTLDEIGATIKDFGTDVKKEIENLTRLEIPTFDEIGTKLSGFGDDIKDKFTEFTKDGVPSFDEVKGKLKNLGTNLAAKFEGLGGIDISKSTKQVADKLKDLASGFSLDGILGGIGQSIQSMPFDFTFGETIKETLLKIFNPMLATDVMGGEEMARGGRVKPGMLYTINEKGVETFVPDQPGQLISAERTRQMMKSGSGGGGSSTILVNAPNTTDASVNNSSTSVASSSIVEPDPFFRRNTSYAI